MISVEEISYKKASRTSKFTVSCSIQLFQYILYDFLIEEIYGKVLHSVKYKTCNLIATCR